MRYIIFLTLLLPSCNYKLLETTYAVEFQNVRLHLDMKRDAKREYKSLMPRCEEQDSIVLLKLWHYHIRKENQDTIVVDTLAVYDKTWFR